MKICDVCGFRGVVMPMQSLTTSRKNGGFYTKGDPNFQDTSSDATRRREGAKGTLFKVLLTIIAAAFGKGSASNGSVLGNTQAAESSDEEPAGAPGDELWRPMADAAESSSSLGRPLRSDAPGQLPGGTCNPWRKEAFTAGWPTAF